MARTPTANLRAAFQSGMCLALLVFSCGLAKAAAPGNDNFANASVLSGPLPISAAGSNIGATKEAGEPNHNGNAGGASIWYSYTAASAAPLIINTSSESNFSTELAVYTGSAVMTLTQVAAGAGSVTFTPTNGTVYMIAVDGFNGGNGAATGAVSLSISSAAPKIISSLNVSGNVGIAFNYFASASSTTSVTFSTTSTLPAGLALSGGSITGTPTATGITNVALTATNASGSDTQTLVITINGTVPPTLSNSNTTSGTVGVVFSQSLFSGGSAATFTTSVLPAGLSLSNGVITGTPTAAGPTIVTVTATNSAGSATQLILFNISAPAANTNTGLPVITSQLTAIGNLGVAFTYFDNATGAQPINFTISPLPPGLTFSPATGQITGTPTATGSTSATITATNSVGSATATLVIAINGAVAPSLFNTTYSGIVNTAFSRTLFTNNGSTPVTFTSSALPAGLTLTNNVISGTPTAVGITNITITATNAGGSDTEEAQITINPAIAGPPPVQAPVFTNSATVTGIVGQSLFYFPSFAANTAPTTVTYASAPLPSGVTYFTFITNGELSGTPLNSGTFSAVVTASNTAGSATQTVTITVNPAPAVTAAITSSLAASATVGKPFSYFVSVNFGTPDSMTASPLPPGLVVEGTSIVGQPTTVGNTQVTLTATQGGASDSKTLLISVFPAPAAAAPVIISPLSAFGNVNSFFSYSFSGATADNSLITASPLPPGITLDSFDGGISGIPTATGTTMVTLTATNQAGSTSATLVVTINPASPAAITGPFIVEGTVGAPFDYFINTFVDGSTIDSFNATPLPPGLVATGLDILGIPTTPGTTSVVVTATGASGTDAQVVVININPAVAPIITSSLTATGNTTSFFSYGVSAKGTGNIVFTASPLPPGLSFNGNNISGTPSSTGTTNVTLTATSAFGTATQTLAITINAFPPFILGGLTTSGTVGQPFNYFPFYYNSPSNVTLTTSALPPGLVLSNGSISGTPTTAGNTTVTLTATDAGGTDTKSLLIVINNPPPPPPPPPAAVAPLITSFNNFSDIATVGQSYSTFVNISGTPPFNFSASPLPLGLSASSDEIFGTPLATGTYSITLTAINAQGSDTKTFTLAVNPPPPAILTSPLTATGTAGVGFVYDLQTSGAAPVTVSATGLPAGLVFTGSQIIGKPTTAGTSNVTLTASNPSGTDTGTLVITINSPAAPAINSALTATGNVGQYFVYVLTASSNTPPGFLASPLPPGLSLFQPGFGNSVNNWTIEGTPLFAGTTNVTLIAANATGTDTKTLAITITTLAPAIDSTLTDTATVGQEYSYFIDYTGSPSTTNATSLPSSLIFDSGAGSIAGTPTTAGTFNITLTAANSAGTDTKTLVLTVSAPVAPTSPKITSALTANGNVGEDFFYFLGASGNPQSFTASPLPPGIQFFNGSGYAELFGTPTTAGTFNVTLTAANVLGTDTQTLVITIGAPVLPNIFSASSATGTINVFFSYLIEAGGSSPITYSATGLPAGLVFTGSLISGVPTATGSFTVAIIASNAAGNSAVFNLALTIIPPTAPTITNALNASASIQSFFNFAITTTGSTPISLNATPLPDGLSFSGGYISGFPTTQGTTSVALRAVNGVGNDSKTLVITVGPPTAPSITSSLVASGAINVPFTYTIQASGASPITFQASPLPPGLTLQSNGTINGTPTALGQTNVNLTATNSLGSATAVLSLTIAANVSAPLITSALTATGTVNSPFVTYSIVASGSTPITITATPLPAGLSLAANGTDIVGTPTAFGTVNVNLTAKNSYGQDAKTLAITINPQSTPVISSITSTQSTALIGDVITFSAVASDPAGLPITFSWNFGDGSVAAAGNPVNYAYTAGGNFTVTVSVSNGGNNNATASLIETVFAPPSNSAGVTNISQGAPEIINPFNGIGISLLESNGGIVELAIDINALNRNAFSVQTNFNKIGNVTTSSVPGVIPVAQFTTAGIFVAKSTATNIATNVAVGKARKTLVISRRETGQAPQFTGTLPTVPLKVTVKKTAGKFSISNTAGSPGALTAPRPDVVTFQGTIELPAGLDVSKSQDFWASLGNIADNVTVDAKGRGGKTSVAGLLKKVSIRYPKVGKATHTTTAGQTATVSLTLSGVGLVNAGFDTEGVVQKPTSPSISIQLAMMLAGAPYEFTIPATVKVTTKGNAASIVNHK